jgi:hypothetical protein
MTFNQIFNTFVRSRKIDVIIKGKLRCELREEIIKTSDTNMFEMLRNNPKRIEVNNLSVCITSPYENPLLMIAINNGLKNPIQPVSETVAQATPDPPSYVLTEIQQLVSIHAETFNLYGAYGYLSSCGSGKTLAAVYLIYKFQCKTLIISTRNAVNDQWRHLLQNLYPELCIKSRDETAVKTCKEEPKVKRDIDIFICTPQYLIGKIDQFKFVPSLIIYDECHTLLSKEFSRVLSLPFAKVIAGEWPELPYLLGLSATYPMGKPNKMKVINTIFGNIHYEKSAITTQPVLICDYRRMKIFRDGDIGKFHRKFNPLSDYEAIEYFSEIINGNDTKRFIGTRFKGIVMTYTIDSSAYAALYMHNKFDCSVLLVRAAGEPSYYIDKSSIIDNTLINCSTTLKTITQNNLGIKCNYMDFIADASIIVGTVQRMKEGISIQYAVWGICTRFVWETMCRVQILGRIRRNSNDDELNKLPRIFYTNSTRVPTNIGRSIVKKNACTILYDFEYEAQVFERENYQYIESFNQ